MKIQVIIIFVNNTTFSTYFAKLKTYLHPESGARVSFLPSRIPHEPLFEPDVNWVPAIMDGSFEWWRDEKYNVGMETIRPIKIRVMNTLIKRSVTLKVRIPQQLKVKIAR
jgi:hypothetical protein